MYRAARVVMIDSTYSAPAPIVEACSDDFAEQLDLDVEQDFLLASDEADGYDAAQMESGGEQDSPPTYGIFYHDGEKLTDVQLPYRLPDDWLFVNSVPEYKGIYG